MLLSVYHEIVYPILDDWKNQEYDIKINIKYKYPICCFYNNSAHLIEDPFKNEAKVNNEISWVVVTLTASR